MATAAVAALIHQVHRVPADPAVIRAAGVATAAAALIHRVLQTLAAEERVPEALLPAAPAVEDHVQQDQPVPTTLAHTRAVHIPLRRLGLLSPT